MNSTTSTNSTAPLIPTTNPSPKPYEVVRFNALKHGIEPALRGGAMVVAAERLGGQVRVRDQDSGVGMSVRPGSGHGLANVRPPLAVSYGAVASLALAEAEPHGLVADIVVLARVGGGSPDTLHVALGQIATAYYFAHFLIILPLISKYEDTLPLPSSISTSALHGEQQESSPLGQTAPAN